MDSQSVAALEAAKGTAPFVAKAGSTFTLPDPRAMPVDDILLVLHAEILRESPPHLPLWKMVALQRAWSAHFDLPNLRSCQRLVYLLDRYRDEIEFDLQQHLHADLTDLWRQRKWRKLLNFIEHLPRESWFSEAVSNDEEHAKMVAQARAEAEADGEESGAYHPPMRTWTPEVEVLTNILDAIRANTHTLTVANAGGKRVPAPDRAPRPQTALEAAEKVAKFNARKAKHERLVARMLPHKAQKSG